MKYMAALPRLGTNWAKKGNKQGIGGAICTPPEVEWFPQETQETQETFLYTRFYFAMFSEFVLSRMEVRVAILQCRLHDVLGPVNRAPSQIQRNS